MFKQILIPFFRQVAPSLSRRILQFQPLIYCCVLCAGFCLYFLRPFETSLRSVGETLLSSSIIQPISMNWRRSILRSRLSSPAVRLSTFPCSAILCLLNLRDFPKLQLHGPFLTVTATLHLTIAISVYGYKKKTISSTFHPPQKLNP